MAPKEFLNLAGHLALSQNSDAPDFRTAISRAYYAAFHIAVETLSFLGFPPRRDASGHDDATRLLQQSGDSELDRVGGVLADLRSDRNEADYKLQSGRVEKRESTSSFYNWRTPYSRISTISRQT